MGRGDRRAIAKNRREQKPKPGGAKRPPRARPGDSKGDQSITRERKGKGRGEEEKARHAREAQLSRQQPSKSQGHTHTGKRKRRVIQLNRVKFIK